jgi:hypothetical protein
MKIPKALKTIHRWAQAYDRFCKGMPVKEVTPELRNDCRKALDLMAIVFIVVLLTASHFAGIDTAIKHWAETFKGF